MKHLFFKIFFIFALFFNICTSGFSADVLNINSVNFDTSGAILSLNSQSIDNFEFSQKPSLTLSSDENKGYIDLPYLKLDCNVQNFVFSNSVLKQLSVTQISEPIQAIRIGFSYNENFNPSSLRLKKLNNTVFIYFKTPSISNYYFQLPYLDSNSKNFVEDITIENPVSVQNNTLGLINSAFNQDTEHNYVLIKKNLLLRSKFYINNISIQNSMPIISGIGSFSLTKPIYLSNPDRVAYDIPNSIVNPAIRNKSFDFGDSSIKIGQFDKSTSRIVITSSNSRNFIPIMFPDNQKIVFTNKNSAKLDNLYSVVANINSVQNEKTINKIASLKLIFDSAVVTGLENNDNSTILLFYNVNKSAVTKLNAALAKSAFSDVKTDDLPNGGFKLIFPTGSGSNFEFYAGVDGKTFRIKQSIVNDKQPEQENEISTPEIKIPEILKRNDGKRYVVLDAGHGGSDCGAIRAGINEKDITLDVTKRVATLLAKKGYVIEMTRTDDSTVSLQERVDISENFYPDIFVSIHVNSSNSDTPNGIETHYYKDNSIDLAKYIHASMLNHINANNRGLFKSKFYVINHTTAPAILVEIGFLSNPAERSQLLTNSRKDATAKAIAEGIDEYFKKH